MFYRAVLCATAIGIAMSSACVSPPQRDEADSPAALTPVVASMVADAQAARSSKDYNQAAAQLERALRIEPANPTLWQELAIVHVEQGSFEQAIQFASKSNSLTRNRALAKKNWQLIAYAYNQLGKKDKAQAAEKRARQQ